MDTIITFDTTARDGAQTAGCSMTPEQVLCLARQAEVLGLNVFEAGFAAASPNDMEAVKKVAAAMSEMSVCSLARATQTDIDSSLQALDKAVYPRVHTFLSTSPIHMVKKVRMSPEQVIEKSAEAVRYAKRFVDDVEYSAEDALRSDPEFLVQVFRAVIETGATTINIPDTVGFSVPQEMFALISKIITDIPEIKERGIIVSVHCHNDLGMAVSNTLAAIQAGARQFEGTINGIGERAGNAHYAEVVMTTKTRPDLYDVDTTIITEEMGPTARLLSRLINKPIPDTLPIVGALAFAHTSGIHQDGTKKGEGMYEIMKPEKVGWREEAFPLSTSSGRNGLRTRLEAIGYRVDDNSIDEVYSAFIDIAEGQKTVPNDNLHLIMQMHMIQHEERSRQIVLSDVSYSCGLVMKFGNIEMTLGNETFKGKDSSSIGPVDALWYVLQKTLVRAGIELHGCELGRYDLGKGHGGTDARGHAHVALIHNGNVGFGLVKDPDIVIASIKALVMAVNHLLLCPVAQSDTDL